MTPRGKTPKFGASVFAAAIAFSIGVFAGAPGAYAGETVATEPSGDFIPGSDRASTRPPATFFTINEVLAKLDRQRGRGPGALRTASLTPSNIATDAAPPVKEAPAVGTEPFGLFTFRAPEGILWRKWRGIESDITKEQAVLDHCREGADAESCPSYAAQFLRVIKAVKAKSGRDQLDEANRAVNMAIRYMSDYAQHGEADRWSAPLASFATGKATARIMRSPNMSRSAKPASRTMNCGLYWFATAPSGRIMPFWPRVWTAIGLFLTAGAPT